MTGDYAHAKSFAVWKSFVMCWKPSVYNASYERSIKRFPALKRQTGITSVTL